MKYLSRYFLVGAFLFSGCESENGGDNAGIEGTGDRVTVASAYGTVSGFGSIYVNGVHFDTDMAQVEIAGKPATEEDLAVGMVVEVIGEIAADGATGVAKNIRAERVLVGVINTIDDVGRGRKAVHLLGQTVYINEDAAFAGTSFVDLAPGLGVSISGFVTDDGLITATYIAQQDIDVTADTLEVEGYVSTVENLSQSFTLKGLTIDAAEAEFIGGGAGDVAPGKRVRVLGTLMTDSQILHATRIEIISAPIVDGSFTSIEGVVRDLNTESSFTLNNVVVHLENAVFENASVDELQDGVRVVVFGVLSQGIVAAERVHLKPLNTSRFRGVVDEINASDRSFKLINTLFRVTRFTQYKDDSGEMERNFNFASLRTGEEIDVFAVNLDGVWQVTRILRQERGMGPPSLLRGEITGVDENDQTFYLANILVDATELPEREWEAIRELQDQPAEVAVEGFYRGEGQFRAIHVHVDSNSSCHPRVFFNCGPGKSMGMRPQSRK